MNLNLLLHEMSFPLYKCKKLGEKVMPLPFNHCWHCLLHMSQKVNSTEQSEEKTKKTWSVNDHERYNIFLLL